MKRKTVKRRSTSKTASNTKRVTLISRRAKQIRKKGEVWTGAIKRASKQLQNEGKL